jgi:PKD repeat protein
VLALIGLSGILADRAGAITIEPGVIFQPSRSWADLSFASRQTFSTVHVDDSGVTFDSVRFGVQKFPSGMPRASLSVTVWSPLQTIDNGIVLRFLGDATTGSTLYFDLSGVLPAREYLLHEDGVRVAQRFSDASGLVSFVWSNWTVHDLNVLLGPGSGLPSPDPLVADFAFAPDPAVVSEPTAFAASVAGGTPPYEVSWDFGDGVTASGLSATHAYGAAGSYAVTLLVSDQAGGSKTVGKIVAVVTAPPTMPVSVTFVVAPSAPRVGDRVAFAASASGGTPPFAYAWDFGDGGNAATRFANYTYVAEGMYTVTLSVRDAASGLDIAARTLVVGPARRVGNVTAAFDVLIDGTRVTFLDRSVSDVGAPIAAWMWAFGDGTSSTEAQPTHVYDVPGFTMTYTVLLSVTDEEGNVGTASRDLTIANVPLVVGTTVVVLAAAAATIVVLAWVRRRRKRGA